MTEWEKPFGFYWDLSGFFSLIFLSGQHIRPLKSVGPGWGPGTNRNKNQILFME
jgi:hypothetical protein